MPLISFSGGRLFGRRHGDGVPRILALHGWARSSADFDVVLEGLPAVALDLPGFGASPPPQGVWGADEYAALVAGMLDELAPSPILLGHSFGGRVAVSLAAGHDAAALVLTGVPLLRRARRPPSLGYRLVRTANRLGIVSEERMERIRRSRGSADYRAARGVLREVLVKVVNESYEERLREVGCPVELVWGADDREVPPEVARRAAALLADAGRRVEVTEVDGAGHLLPLEAPEQLRAVIERHLSVEPR